ncbi:MAG: hypothetical protein KDH96_11920, partial [Candidatus Riesia sp.]|nr:hypothetical protein [Candidatus Riesia sp.]
DEDWEEDEKMYSVSDIYEILEFLNKNYSKIEDELANKYESNNEDLPEDFFKSAYEESIKRAINNLKK